MMRQGLSRHEASQLVRLARAFRERRLLAEAADLLQAALAIAPDDEEAVGELAALRREERETGAPRRPGELLREQLRRDAIDGAHFLGLAHLYAEKGENAQALDCLEVARAKELADPAVHKLAGRIQFRRGQLDEAAAELALALRWNPFDRETAELLGRVELERGRREPALGATIHAFLLVDDAETEAAERLRRRVRTLRQILGWDSHALARLFRERQEQLHVAFDRLQWRRERFLEEEGLVRSAPSVGAAPAARTPGGRIALAARLRRQKVLAGLSDEQVFQLTRVADEEVIDAGGHLFRHHDPERDLYLLTRGDLVVQRTTGYGTFSLGTCGGGDLLGEVGFLTGADRSGDAVAVTPLQLVRFEAEPLERLLADDVELAVALYSTLWHALAKKLRGMNAQLQSFFDPGALPENFLRLRRPQRVLQDAVKVESSDKIRLFREQGLSRRELVTLATFSEERRFPENAYVFQEGDQGQELYVVLEGRVMICKYIPGGGEEALAILDRGDFFGEMSLLDGEPRSADARAHGGPLTVLALDEARVREVLSMDAAAAVEFLRLLCRLLADRLREIDDKVIGWRILAGGQAETVSA
ncbi:MAG TPA: cyclic nucleotide-binding domain-containing protein [Thermoanaerobaculia bacterium]|nr:cyclic nucleotide-binding domain-containing protein [Thermoanaerobaculia bacterium]